MAPTGQGVTVEHAIDVLNRIHEADPQVLPGLIGYRVLCNRQVADDPTVQVGTKRHGPRSQEVELYEVGLLGILNGIFGTQPDTEAGWIAAEYGDDGRLTRFALFEPE